MTLKIAINGFGRIGRMVLRALCEHKHAGHIEVVAINDLGDPSTNAHLFHYDSVHGRYAGSVTLEDNQLCIDQRKIPFLQEKDPARLPWQNVDLVLECTGRFTNHAEASLHLQAGAKRVLVSAPCTNADATIVYGVNHTTLKPTDQIISNASCTTNCLAPMAMVLDQALGLVSGYMTTIHAYTGDQRLVDTYHSDIRRARAAGLSMIPTSTGAAKAVGLVLPNLAGKLDGTSIRIPSANVSVVDLTFVCQTPTTPEEINSHLQKASEDQLKGILAYNAEPLVSIDFNHHPASSIFDSTQTQVVQKTFCRVLSWYDNEWGFSNRMVDMALHLSK